MDNTQVEAINSYLDTQETIGNPNPIQSNIGLSYQGSLLQNQGFVLTQEEALDLLKKDKRNADVVKPYLRGEDFNANPDQSASYWVIDFLNMPLLQAETYPDCMKIIREKVYPDRMGEENRKTYEKMWWQFWRPRVELYRKASQYERILFHPFTSKYLLFSFVPVGIVYTAPHILIVTPENYHFAVLQSNFHESWARKYGSTLETRLRYAPSDVFENFPFPKDLLKLEDIGKSYFEHRRQIMLSRQEGLTSTYNRFHNPEEESGDIVRLRELHVEMDRSVASAYGWDDLELGHDFHETAQGIRFTVSESARREVLSRLLRLNHERYEEEQKSKDELGMMNDEKKSKGKRAKKVKSAGDGQMGLL